MLRILTYEEIDREEWGRLVATSRTGTWFQGPEAYDFFASQPELFHPFVVAISKETSLSEAQHSIIPSLHTLRAVCCGYVTKERNPLKQFFTRRAIIIGGPALADDCTDEEVQLLMEAVRKQPILNPFLKERTSNRSSLKDGELPGIGSSNGRSSGERSSNQITGKRLLSPIYIETRNFNDYGKWKEAFEKVGFDYQPHLNFHVDTSSVEIVDNNISKSRKRDIRTTIREGVTIVDSQELRGNSQELERRVHEYYLILKNLYETKVKTPLFPESFFQSLATHPDAQLLLVELNGKIIGGTVCVQMAGRCTYEWYACGEDGVYPHVFPSSYATYAGIRYAAEHNIPRFDMMGAGKPDESYGVRDFKAKFGGKEVEHGRFIAINNKWLYHLGTLGIALMQRESLFHLVRREKHENVPGKKEWSRFVARHPQGTIFQTPEMYAVYQQAKRQKPMVVSIRRDGEIRGLLLANIQWNGSEWVRPLTARSIIVGGPLVADNDKDVLQELMAEYQRRLPKYVVYSEIRPIYDVNALVSESVKDLGIWRRVGHYNLALRVDEPEEELWNGMHKERRRNVGQAEKAGLRFEEVRTEAGRKEVIILLHKTYARKHVPMADDSMFFQLAELMPHNVHFFAAYHEDKMIAGQIRLGYKDLLYAWYAGSDEQYFKLRPNDFLMWNVIKWAHEKGYTRFDFGGGGEPGKPYGVRDYKLKYGCEMKDYGRWICVKRPIIYGMAKQMYAMLHKE